MTTESGLQYTLIAAGDGPAPQPGDIVAVTVDEAGEYDLWGRLA